MQAPVLDSPPVDTYEEISLRAERKNVIQMVFQRSFIMKSLQTRILAIAGLGLLGICASASQSAAQNTVTGSFTLSHEIHWQNTTFPAGDYTFSIPSKVGREPMLVKGPSGAAYELPAVTSYKHSDQAGVLILEQHGKTFFVREMDLNGVGLQLRYSVPKAPKNEMELAQGPTSTEQVPVAMASK